MAQWYGLTQEEVLKRLGTNRTGLNEKEAERRLETYGENVLKEQERGRKDPFCKRGGRRFTV